MKGVNCRYCQDKPTDSGRSGALSLTSTWPAG
jgi:hypothetical protein